MELGTLNKESEEMLIFSFGCGKIEILISICKALNELQMDTYEQHR